MSGPSVNLNLPHGFAYVFPHECVSSQSCPVTGAKAGADAQAPTQLIRPRAGCGADCRLSSYRKGRRNLAHEDEEGERDVSDQPSGTGPTLLSLQPQHCILSPLSTPTILGVALSIPSIRGPPTGPRLHIVHNELC